MVVPLRLASSIYISIYHFNSRSIKLKFTLSFALTVIWLITLGQRSGIELTFTAVNNTTYVQLDSIRFMNRTQGGETMLFWPDTVLTVLWVGIPESSSVSDGFNQYQNYPNGKEYYCNLHGNFLSSVLTAAS
ncbi:MAG: hypothetical protein PHD25_06225 [Bacteroidales bacterium]|nr:hypothetical protein [Bacteroidales bacterium]